MTWRGVQILARAKLCTPAVTRKTKSISFEAKASLGLWLLNLNLGDLQTTIQDIEWRAEAGS